MRRRRPSIWRHIILALLVLAALWWAKLPPFRRSDAPPPASMLTSGHAAGRSYAALGAAIRDKVPLEEFATMLRKMTDPDLAEGAPEIRDAQVVDGTGPEYPRARFRVEYPGSQAEAEYHFVQIEGVWRLQSFTRDPGEWTAPEAEVKPRASTAAAPSGSAPPEKSAPQRPAGKAPAPTTATRPPAPRYYVLQPGDTLMAISRLFYGTTRYWRRILEANPGLNERRLRVGRQILIPSAPGPLPPKPGTALKPTTAAP